MTKETSPKPRRSRWRSVAIEVLLLIVVVTVIRLWQQRDMVSGAAPALQGATLAGQHYKLPARPERPVLVHFWATWCPVCRAEQDSISGIARDSDVISVAMQSGKAEEVAAYVKEKGIDFPVLNDADGSISNTWGVHAVPASFIIAPDGQIQFVEVGYTTEIGLRLRLWWAGS
ncbi:MAG TPA: protein disulfide oxidoreductase [Gallionellaceae bacterium]|nr:protein disulfide oxidoreductase [Gallionellaceae bacterium]